MKSIVRSAMVLLAAFTLLTGLAYPLLTTATAQLLFSARANGSLKVTDHGVVGSRLVGQAMTGDRWFWGRPSAIAAKPYDAMAAAGSNLGPSNPALIAAVRDRVTALRAAHPTQTGPIPIDLVTSSGSGLDPDVSPAAAFFQVDRVAHARGVDADRVRAIVRAHVEQPLAGVLGPPHVNVLELNLALEEVLR